MATIYLYTTLAICLLWVISTCNVHARQGWHFEEPSEEYFHEVLLHDSYKLFWKFTEENITFEVQVKTQGWVGFGISPNGGMAGADLIMVWAINDEQTNFTDRHGIGNQEPKVDTNQDWFLLQWQQNEDGLTFKFWRPLYLCDNEDLPIEESTLRIIWAFNPERPVDNNPQWHGPNKGSRSLNLLSHTEDNIDLPDDVIQWNFTVNNLSLPVTDTFYWCQLFDIPPLPQKHHVIRVEPIFTEGLEQFLHHVIVYRCLNDDSDDADGLGHECYQPNMPPSFRACGAYMLGWAVGDPFVNMPDHIGYPFDPEDSTLSHLMLEMHYDNPGLVTDLLDFSGLRLYATPTVRQHDAGILTTGAIVLPSQSNHIIPPYAGAFQTYNHCPSQCLTAAFEEDGVEEIHVVAAGFHAHLSARRMRLHHFRDGKELPLLATENNFDFNFQSYRFFEEERTILKTDILETVCECDTRDRTELTWGGLSSQDEMCQGYLIYYPKVFLANCATEPSPLQNLKVIDAVTVPIGQSPGYRVVEPKEFENQTHLEIFPKLNWTDPCLRDKYQNVVSESPGEYRLLCDTREISGKNLINVTFLADPDMEVEVCGWQEDKEEEETCQEEPDLTDTPPTDDPGPGNQVPSVNLQTPMKILFILQTVVYVLM